MSSPTLTSEGQLSMEPGPTDQGLIALHALEAVEAAVSTARRNVAALEAQNATLRANYQQCEAQSVRLSAEVAQLRVLLDSAQVQHRQLEAENQALEGETQRLHSEKHGLEREQQALQTEKTALEAAKQSLESEKLDWQAKHQQQGQENALLNERVAELSRDLENSNEAIASLHRHVTDLHRGLNAEDLPTLVIKLAMELTGAQVGLFTAADGDDTLAKLGFKDLAPPIVEALYNYSRSAAHAEAPVVENDASKLPDGSQLVNLAALPVATKGQSIGVLLLANKREGSFSDADTRLLLAIGQHAGIALENYRLHERLSEAYVSTVAVLADAIEAKDAYTRGHCEDVARVAVEVAQHLGVSGEALESVRYAALLHDVGKIGVPDGVLLKPGKLLPEEFSIIQRHASIGRDLVARVPALAELSEAILHHHERWDGSGYPDGLSGEGIPLVARIICAVDAYDAMTTPRPYRTPFSRAEALNEMRRCAGTHFDPQVVETVMAVVSSSPINAAPHTA